MDAADVIAVLDRLDGVEIDAWLDGGWGVGSVPNVVEIHR
jgi:hypothetical protein